jgi:hypothetical protein
MSAGTVQQKRTGLLAVLLGFLYTLLDIVQTFFSTLISPDAQQTVMKRRRDDYGGGGGSGRPGGGPRITGEECAGYSIWNMGHGTAV